MSKLRKILILLHRINSTGGLWVIYKLSVMYKHHYSPSLTQHCDELDNIPALTLRGTASQGHSRACNHIQLTLYPGLLPFLYWALHGQPCPGFSHMPTDACLRDWPCTHAHTHTRTDSLTASARMTTIPLPYALPKPCLKADSTHLFESVHCHLTSQATLPMSLLCVIYLREFFKN